MNGSRRFQPRRYALVIRSLVVMHASLIFGVVARAQSANTGENSNCVDRCVIEYARNYGRELSRESLAETLTKLGLERNLRSRSLAECREILNTLGLPAAAIRLKVGPKSSLSTAGIVYLRGETQTSIGHVILIRPDQNGGYQIFDPVDENRTGFIRNIDELLNYNTIAIVPRDYARSLALKSGSWALLLSLAIVFCMATLAWVLLRRMGITPRPERPIRSVTLALAMISAISCGRPTADSSLSISTQEHDFGRVMDEDSYKPLTHTFNFTNRGNQEFKLTASPSSCGCMVAEGSFDGRLIRPGETVDLPVSINTTFKTGRFRETILIRTDDQRVQDRLIALTGFIQRLPKSSSSKVLLRYGSDGNASGEALVNYVRLTMDKPAALEGCVVVPLDGEDLTNPSKFDLQVDHPQHSQSVTGSDTTTEVFRVPIRLKAYGPRTTFASKLRLSWSFPKTETEIDIVAEPLAAIELSSRRVYLAPIKSGSPHVENLPIRIHETDIASNAKFVSDNPDISAKLDVARKIIQLTVHPKNPGPISSHQVIELENGPPIKFEIRGMAD